MSEKEYKSPNSPIVEYGGPFVGCCILWVCILFYPALVIAMQFGMSFFHSEDAALIPSLLVGLLVLGIIFVCLELPIPICRYFVYFLYFICLVPALQYFWFVGDAKYVTPTEYQERISEMGKVWETPWDSSSGYEFLQEPFSGFNWWWFVPGWGDWFGIFGNLFQIIFPTLIIILIIRWILKACGKI